MPLLRVERTGSMPAPAPGRNRPWTRRPRPGCRWSCRRSSWPGRIWRRSCLRVLRPLGGGLGGGLEQRVPRRSCVGGDGVAGGDQGVHHGLVAHLGAGHVVQLLKGLGEDGLEAAPRRSRSPSGASSCKPSSQVFHRGTALPPLRVITAMAASSSMAWMPPSDGVHCFGDSPGDLRSWSGRGPRRRIWSRSPSAPPQRRSQRRRRFSGAPQIQLLSCDIGPLF